MQNIYWINLSRFDESVSKAPRLEISEALINENFSVTLLTGFKDKKYIPEGYKIKIKYFKTINRGNLFKISLSFAILSWLMKHIKPNDILMVTPEALWLAIILRKIRNFRLHLDIRTVPVDIINIRRKIESFLYWVLPLKLFWRYPDSYSFITELLKQNVENEIGARFKDYAIWTSGVNSNHYACVRDTPPDMDDKYIITYLGVISKNRGIDRVLEAMHKLPENYKDKIIFQIIGSGSYLPNLIERSLKLQIDDKVIFKGYVPYESVPQCLQSTGCFICPLPDREEWNVSSPIKVFEYLACARPVILTPIPAHKNIVNRNDFIIWTQGDSIQDFTIAIQYAFDNRISLANYAKMAPDYVRDNYEWKSQGKRLSTYLRKRYREVL